MHIFAPNYKHRFGGPIFDWKYAFSHWNDPEIQHLVFDSENQKILDSKEAFDFAFTTNQFIASKGQRFKWIFTLLKLVNRKRNEFDILHFHVLWWAGLLTASRAKRLGVPTIYQSVLLNEDTPSGIVAQKLGELKLRYLKKFTTILPIADYLTEDYLKFGFSPTKVHTLMNSVDTNFFHPTTSQVEKRTLRKMYSLPEEAKILVFVGSIIQRKGVDILTKAFITAAQRDNDLCLIVVGARNKQENPSLDEDFVSNLHKELEENGVSNKVTFLGLIQNRDQLADLYRLSDIFVFPSRNEGLPNVVLEAMACGLPVIVSRLPVLENVIANGENGFFVPIDDAVSLSDAIIKLAFDPTLRQSLGQAANRYTITHHSFAKWQARIAELYRSLVLEK